MKKLFAGLAVLPVLFFCSPASAAENNTLPDNQTAVVKEYTTTNPNFAEQFDHTVVNDDLKLCVSQVAQIIRDTISQ